MAEKDKPSNASAPIAFVAMTFDGRLQPVYLKVIRPVLGQYGYDCVRADEDSRMGIIVSQIREAINAASLILCDLTFHNPNVFYELGIAHALGKQPLLLSQNPADLPFDVRHLRVIPYTDDKYGLLDLREQLVVYLETELPSSRTAGGLSSKTLPATSDELENQRFSLFANSTDSKRWALKFLGEHRDKLSFDRILQLACDAWPSADVARDAFTALYNIDPKKARPILVNIGLRYQQEFLVRERVVELLGQYGPDDELVSQLCDQISDSSWGVRRAVCEVLGRWSDRRAIAQLRGMLNDSEAQVRLAAVDALSRFQEGQFGDEEPQLRQETAEVLERIEKT